jgi:peptide/nickel transport system ATP-binding protein
VSRLLEVEGLSTELHLRGVAVRVVDDVSFSLEAGAALGLVGESGCGKTVTALSLMALLPDGGRVVAGKIHFDGAARDARARSALRGRGFTMMFQEPASALNPVLSIGEQIAEPLRLQQGVSPAAARTRAAALLREVGLGDPELLLARYPHQLSGGMRQRVLLAAALACEPRLLIADEPTTALDATVQAQVLEVLLQLKRSRNLALLLISHDLSAVARVCERVAVLYAGKVIEEGPTPQVLSRPRHPYTRGLIDARPVLGLRGAFAAIAGQVPLPGQWPSGCRFRDRCTRATDLCLQPPATTRDDHGHAVACHHPLA